MTTQPRAFVIAASPAHAEDWLTRHAARVRGFRLFEVTTELTAQRVRLCRGDRIVYVPGWTANPDARAILRLLDTAYTTTDEEEGTAL